MSDERPSSTDSTAEPVSPLVFTLYVAAPAADGSYPLHGSIVRDGAEGVHGGADEVHSTLQLPPRLVDRATRMLRPHVQFEGGDEAELGAVLARQLLQAPMRSLLLKGVAQAREEQTALHIQLRLDAPELTLLPWEWLTVAGKHRWSPALLEDYGLSRVCAPLAPKNAGRLTNAWSFLSSWVSRPASRAALRPASLRVLLVAARERDATLREVGTALEALEAIYDLEIDLLVAPRADELRRALRRTQPHILHMVARVEFDQPDHPLLLLDSLYEAADLVSLAGSSSPPIVVLDGGWREAESLAAGGTRLAYALIAAGLDAAVAFESPLYPNESALFAQAFYTALLEGESPHQATTAGRRALESGGAGGAWGLPLLVRRAQLPVSAAVYASRDVERIAPSVRQRLQLRASAATVRRRRELAVLLVALAVGLAAAGSVITWQSHTAQGGERASATPLLTSSRAPAALGLALPSPTFAAPVTRSTLDLTPTAASSPTAALPTSAPTQPAFVTPAPPVGWATYLVKPNDTLRSIAERTGSSAEAIAAINRIDLDGPPIVERALMVPVYRAGAASVGGIDINRGRQDVPLVALTFDTEINDTMLYQICDILRGRGIHATFFVTGRWVQAYPNAARRIVADGHELGNHSLTHPDFTRIGADGAVSEVQRTHDMIVAATGVDPRPFFRFPYGSKNKEMLNMLANQGYLSYHWTADEGTIPGWLASIAAEPKRGYGAILLLHERPASIAALPGWLDQLRALNITPVPLSQILK